MQSLQGRLSVVVCCILLGGAVPAAAQNPDEVASDLEMAISDVQDAIDELEQYRYISDDNDPDERAEAKRAVRSAKRAARHAAISLLLVSVEPAKAGDLDKVITAIELVMPELKLRKQKQAPAKK